MSMTLIALLCVGFFFLMGIFVLIAVFLQGKDH